MNDKDDKNLNISTGRDLIYNITHGAGAVWLALIIAIIVGVIVGGSIWNSNNQEQKNQQLQEANQRIFELEKKQENLEAVAKADREEKLKQEAEAETAKAKQEKAEAEARAAKVAQEKAEAEVEEWQQKRSEEKDKGNPNLIDYIQLDKYFNAWLDKSQIELYGRNNGK